MHAAARCRRVPRYLLSRPCRLMAALCAQEWSGTLTWWRPWAARDPVLCALQTIYGERRPGRSRVAPMPGGLQITSPQAARQPSLRPLTPFAGLCFSQGCEKRVPFSPGNRHTCVLACGHSGTISPSAWCLLLPRSLAGRRCSQCCPWSGKSCGASFCTVI